MNGRITLLLSVLIAIGAAAGTTYFLSDKATKGAPHPVDASQLEVLANRMAAIEGQNAKLETTLTELNRAIREVARAAPREVPAASNAQEASAVDAKTDKPKAGDPGAKKNDDVLTLDAALKRLGDPTLSFLDREEFWGKIRAAGLVDQVIADYEKRAKADPQNPDLQVALAEAYLKKLQDVPEGPLKGVWANKADAAYDTALAADPEHWSARFSKAVSLSFWPPALGKQGEAIKNFEVLLSQQANKTPRPEFAQTYLFLGNMYQQSGQGQKGLDTWKAGLKLFPDNAALKNQIANAPH